MPETEKSGIQFFGEVDYDIHKKRIVSEYPAYYFEESIDGLKEEITKAEKQIENDMVAKNKLPEYRENLRQRKERLDGILESIPKLDDKMKDLLIKAKRELEKEIKSGLFSRSSMVKGLADANEEARRMVEAKIPVKPEMVEFLKGANIPISSTGKISRTQAEKAYKIWGKVINLHGGDEPTDSEYLRKD